MNTDTSSFLDLPYPENLIRTIDTECRIDNITDTQIRGVEEAIYALPVRMAEIIRFRFQYRMTFPKIAQQYGIPAERVRHLCLKALDRLRRPERFELILLGSETVEAMRKSTEEAKEKETAETDRADHEAFCQAAEKLHNPDLKTMLVSDLCLSVRVRNWLIRDGITTLEDLWVIAARHPERYTRLQGIGEVSHKEISDKLKKMRLL